MGVLLPLLFSSVYASEQSEALVKQGNQALARNEWAAALAKFNAAVAADPNDMQAAFFKAVVLSRTGGLKEAIFLLQTAEKAGFKHSQLDFELGLATMNAGQFDKCVEYLERYENEHPGYGQASEFLGRCHLALGQHDKAEAALNKALKNDPNLKISVALHLVILEKSRNNLAAAQKHLEMASLPDGALLRAWREWLVAPQPPPASQPKFVSVSLSATTGWNDNVIGLSDAAPWPTGIESKAAMYTRANLNLGYTKKLDGNTSMNFGYALLADVYKGFSIANMQNHYFYGDLQKVLNEKSSLSLRLSDEYTLMAGKKLRNQLAVRPAYIYRFSPYSATEFAMGLTAVNYYNAPISPQNRNGNLNTLEANHYVFSEGKLLGFLGYLHSRNLTQGSDFTFTTNSISARFIHLLGAGISVEAGGNFSHSGYDNINSFSGYARSDDTQVLTFQATRPVNKNARLFIRYNATRNRSNIPFYAYKQNITSVGIETSY